MQASPFHDLFCIYHPADSAFMRRLAAQMRASGINCWFDDSDFSKLTAQSAQLTEGILRAHTVAVVLSHSSAESQLCNELIQRAVSQSKRIVTLVREADISVAVHPAIVGSPWRYFRDEDDLVDCIAQLRPLLAVDEDLRLHTELLVAADAWRAGGRKREALLPASRHEEARQWLARAREGERKPSQPLIEFIHSSRRRGRQIGARARKAAWAVLGLVAVGFGAILLQALSQLNSSEAAAIESRAAQTQTALKAAEATAASNDAVALVDRIAATSARLHQSVGATAAAAAAQEADARATAHAQATSARATQARLPMRHADGLRLLTDARESLANDDAELALALAWEARAALTAQDAAIRALRLIVTQLDSPAQREATAGSILPLALPGTQLVGDHILHVNEGGISLRGLDDRHVADLPRGILDSVGSFIAVYSGERATVYSTRDGAEVRSWDAPLRDLRSITLSADGRQIVASRGQRLWLLNADSEAPIPLGVGEAGAARQVAFSTDGRFMTLHAELALLWTADGVVQGAFPLGANARAQAAFHGDAPVVYLQLEHGLAVLTRLSMHADEFALTRHTLVDAKAGALANDGDMLALARLNGDIDLIDTRDGGLIRQLPGAGSDLVKLAILPGGERLAAAAGKDLLLWHIPSGELEMRYPQEKPVSDFSASGDAIITRDADGSFRLWQLEAASELLARIENDYPPRDLSCIERDRHNARPLCM